MKYLLIILILTAGCATRSADGDVSYDSKGRIASWGINGSQHVTLENSDGTAFHIDSREQKQAGMWDKLMLLIFGSKAMDN